MIDTAEETTCPACGSPIIQIAGRGHRKRLYCDDTCRQRAHRKRQEPQHTANVSQSVTNGDLQQRIAELEQELTCSQKNLAAYQEKVTASVARIQRLESQVETQRLKLKEAYHSKETRELVIVHQEQELARYREIVALMDRAKMEARFMALGEQLQYQTLTTLAILGGYGYWQDFMKRAKDEDLLKAIAAAEYYLEGLIALRGDPRELRIAELERQVKDLQAGRDDEERFFTDTRKRDFKVWLRSHPQPTDTDFFKCFLDDRNMPSSASRSLYEARLQLHNVRYSVEDIELFRDAWRRMLFNQS